MDITARRLPSGGGEAQTIDLGELSVRVERADGAAVEQRFVRARVPGSGFEASPNETVDNGELETAESADLLLIASLDERQSSPMGAAAVSEGYATLLEDTNRPFDGFVTTDVTPTAARIMGRASAVAPELSALPPVRRLAYTSWVQSESAPWSEPPDGVTDANPAAYRSDPSRVVTTQLEFTEEAGGATAKSPAGDIILQGTKAGYVLLGQLSATTVSETQLAYAVKSGQPPQPRTLRRLLMQPGPHWETRRRRFLADAEIAENIEHPNIIRVRDWGQHLGSPFVVREVIDGMNLRGMVGLFKGRVPLSLVVAVAGQIADALAFLENAHPEGAEPIGMFNGELALSSIMIERPALVKISEPSLTRLEGNRLTAGRGARRGFAGYAAPEQLAGGHVDARTDVFSLGVVMAELLSGQPLMGSRGAGLEDLAHEIQVRCAARPDVPIELTNLLLAMTQIDVGDRPRNARAVSNKISGIRQSLRDQRPAGSLLAPMFERAARGVTPPPAPPDRDTHSAPPELDAVSGQPERTTHSVAPVRDTHSVPPDGITHSVPVAPGPHSVAPAPLGRLPSPPPTDPEVPTHKSRSQASLPPRLTIPPDSRLVGSPPRSIRHSRSPMLRVRTTAEEAAPVPTPDYRDPKLLEWLDDRYVTRAQWNVTLGLIFFLSAVIIVLGGLLLKSGG